MLVRSWRKVPSAFVARGREPFPEVVQKIYDEINAEYNTDYKVPTN